MLILGLLLVAAGAAVIVAAVFTAEVTGGQIEIIGIEIGAVALLVLGVASALAILWASAILSAFIDNIPFVATMIPLIKAMGPSLGGDAALAPLWWSLSLGACLGGNGTLIGASANLVVAGLAERAGTGFRFVTFLKVAFPLMLISIVLSHVYVSYRFL